MTRGHFSQQVVKLSSVVEHMYGTLFVSEFCAWTYVLNRNFFKNSVWCRNEFVLSDLVSIRLLAYLPSSLDSAISSYMVMWLCMHQCRFDWQARVNSLEKLVLFCSYDTSEHPKIWFLSAVTTPEVLIFRNMYMFVVYFL